MRSLSILLCGYGWFAGIPEGETNNAELIARALDGETLVCGDVRATVRGMTMPVLWRGAFEPVQAAIDAQKPDLVLALGTDARAGALRPEPFGVNWRRGRDAGDTPEENSPIFSGEAEWLRGTLPYAQMVRAMLAAGVPARLGALTPAGRAADRAEHDGDVPLQLHDLSPRQAEPQNRPARGLYARADPDGLCLPPPRADAGRRRGRRS